MRNHICKPVDQAQHLSGTLGGPVAITLALFGHKKQLSGSPISWQRITRLVNVQTHP
jgi:hypothetical protein